MAKILVTGGAGYIGSHTIVDLIENGFDVICIDNFSRSLASSLDGIKAITDKEIKNYCIDLCNYQDTKNVFEENKDIVGVIHFAAFKAVGESVQFPLKYYRNNLFSLVNLLTAFVSYTNLGNIAYRKNWVNLLQGSWVRIHNTSFFA